MVFSGPIEKNSRTFPVQFPHKFKKFPYVSYGYQIFLCATGESGRISGESVNLDIIFPSFGLVAIKAN